MWDGGYDIVNDLDGVLTQFDKTVGLSRLRAVHINDSMNPLGAHKDRHAKIGEGHIGFEAFRRIINHPALRELPFILETPNDDAGWARKSPCCAKRTRDRRYGKKQRPLVKAASAFAEEDSPVLERPEQIMVDLVVFLRKNIKNDQEPGRGI